MAFCIGFYAYAIIGHTRADQYLPQLFMEQFDTLPTSEHCDRFFYRTHHINQSFNRIKIDQERATKSVIKIS